MNKVVEFNVKKLNEFEAAYKEAVEKEKHAFLFEGEAYVVSYAKYLIEYLRINLGEE